MLSFSESKRFRRAVQCRRGAAVCKVPASYSKVKGTNMPFTPQFASVNGTSLAYRDTSAGMPILFIHGHPFNQSMWDAQVDALRWKHRVITYDIRGYGLSQVPAAEATTLETLADDIADLLDHLKIPTAVITGLSMGGQIAMAFADQYPQRLSGLILAATFPQADTPEAAATRRATADRFLTQGSIPPGIEMLPKLLAPATIKDHPDIALKVLSMIARTSPAGAAAALRGRAQRKDYTPTLPKIAVPTLIVVGTEDAYTNVDTAKVMQQSIPHSRLEIFEGIGHLPNLEATDRFNAVLHNFLDTIPTQNTKAAARTAG
ncbi:pimeloyl-ACP methyl ester carboxylesterase [Edaphobacter aggregans]|uniref:Pimeloyl-ACP methyl ester carboxylesterase n=2 Tax=Edaphobacter aggregans TaxID=570835 RepID=A0A3R9NU79_9BACT|nr:pimeloyl-ACP methyl ester carboxylesterase [Edaphobacter aggregans]